MSWFWCQLWNNYGNPVRVVVISNFGQGTYFVNPGQYQWVQWFPGIKVLIAFDQFSGALVTTYTFNVTGSISHAVVNNPGIPFSPGTPTSGTAPGPVGPGPTN